MGVPTFFKWLSVRYPRVLADAIEPDSVLLDSGEFVPPDPSIALEPNPNGEFDHVYLDMNGIIHPCCHPEGCEPPESEADMFEAIFDYIDRLVLLLRPRRLLYMAIDGVAPRAKMNQQRMRRFKSAAEASENEKLWEELRHEAEEAGRAVPFKKPHWDHNVITPGTPFFARLSQALRWYILQRQLCHPAWKELRVVLSDANVPGEGEHKIMAFVRQQRHVQGYDPNTRHCLCGADADLIMLGLATHEAHFSIIREQVQEKDASKACTLCGQKGHAVADCPQAAKDNNALPRWTLDMQRKGWQPMTFLHLPILREYLAEEFCFREHLAQHGVLVPVPKWRTDSAGVGNPLSAPQLAPNPEQLAASEAALQNLRVENRVFLPELERCIDDFIIMCFYVGNDFLPHLPSLSIHKGSIDQMILLYQHVRPLMPDYLCDAGKLNLSAMRMFARHLGEVEGDVFRAELRRQMNMRRRQEEEQQQQQQQQQQQNKQVCQTKRKSEPAPNTKKQEDANYAALEELKKTLFAGNSLSPPGAAIDGGDDESSVPAFEEATSSSEEDLTPPLMSHNEQIDLFKKKLKDKQREANEHNDVQDEVGLGEGDPRDWRRRYYCIKFDQLLATEPVASLERLAGEVARRYAEGLQWVALYYFQGVPSWGWFFPFHYAPLASDVAQYGFNQPFSFDTGTPFKPFHQLMAVLPARSSHCLPARLQKLMTDPHSPIRDFYPNRFAEDPDGKRFRWQWVVKLPFIDHARLVAAVDAALAVPEAKFDEDLQIVDRERNLTGIDQIFLPAALPSAKFYQESFVAPKPATNSEIGIDPQAEQIPLKPVYDKIGGVLHVMLRCSKPENFPPCGHMFDSGVGDSDRFPPISATASSVVGYTAALTGKPGKTPPRHKSILLRGAKISTGVLNPGDWANDTRRFNSGPAKRMILGSLARQGIIDKDQADRYFNQMRGQGGGGMGGRYHHHNQDQPQRDNRYEQEMFGSRRFREGGNNFDPHKRARRN